MWEGPPDMKRWMTRFAFAGKWVEGSRVAEATPPGVLAKREGVRSEARAAVPKPVAVRPRRWRRVRRRSSWRGLGLAGIMSILRGGAGAGEELAKGQREAGQDGRGVERVVLGVCRRLARGGVGDGTPCFRIDVPDERC